jgi:hypothetical protein
MAPEPPSTLADRRCFCSAPLRVEDGLVLCAAGHVLALASAVGLEAGADGEAAD